MKILQGRFRWEGTRESYEEAAKNYVEPINQYPGLLWKIWAFDDEKMIATGIYLYKDEESAQAAKKRTEDTYEAGNFPEDMKDIKITIWDVQEELSRANRAPI